MGLEGEASQIAVLLRRLADKVEAEPDAVERALALFAGRSDEGPDPVFLAPRERLAYVAELAQNLGISSAELLLLNSARTTNGPQ